MKTRTHKAISIIDGQLGELNALVDAVRESQDFDVGFERLRRWKERTIKLVGAQVHPREAEKLGNKRMGSIVLGAPLHNFISQADMYRGFLVSLGEELVQHPEDVLDVPVPVEGENPLAQVRLETQPDSIFIIHGHDEVNLLRLKELLKERWGLNPYVLKAKAGKGRTLIEKFEDEAQPASYAFALLTPDDIIDKANENYAQPRPNVVFELGWFYGRLGRERVCILHKRSTKIHSDLEGITRIEFQESVNEKLMEIEQELLAAKLLKPQ